MSKRLNDSLKVRSVGGRRIREWKTGNLTDIFSRPVCRKGLYCSSKSIYLKTLSGSYATYTESYRPLDFHPFTEFKAFCRKIVVVCFFLSLTLDKPKPNQKLSFLPFRYFSISFLLYLHLPISLTLIPLGTWCDFLVLIFSVRTLKIFQDMDHTMITVSS